MCVSRWKVFIETAISDRYSRDVATAMIDEADAWEGEVKVERG